MVGAGGSQVEPRKANTVSSSCPCQVQHSGHSWPTRRSKDLLCNPCAVARGPHSAASHRWLTLLLRVPARKARWLPPSLGTAETLATVKKGLGTRLLTADRAHNSPDLQLLSKFSLHLSV